MKRMVWIAIILGILAATVLAFFISRNRWTTLPTGGERKDHTDPNAPKVIESTEIVEFHCEFSTLTLVGAEKLRRGVYSLDAVSGENAVSGNYSLRIPGEEGEHIRFTAEPSFLEALQELVAKYDFAKHNGLSVRVSGLPNLYGVRLQVEYASGEFIHAYHNQSRFLTEEEMAALVALFYEQAETPAKDGESGEE